MDILGISAFYHDSAACLYRDGKIIAAAQEERFSRKKHDMGWPTHAIQFVLREANTTIDKIDYVAFYEKPLLKFERLIAQFVVTYPFSWSTFLQSLPAWLSEKLLVPTYIREMGYTGKVYYIPHHLSHASASYLLSPFDDAAILTVDGVGEWSTTTFGVAKNNHITLQKEIRFPHSLGLFYSALTAFLGFKVNNSEYKVMGLAPLGKPIYYEKLRKLIDMKEDGSFELNMRYFDYHAKMSMVSQRFIDEFGAIRKPESELTQYHKDLAASLQKVTEEVMLNLLNALQKETGKKNLCLSGGVALNSVSNGKILKQTKFKNVFIQPAAGDAGSSLGAAAFVYHSILNHPRKHVQETASLGPQFSDEEIEKFLRQKNISYTQLKTEKELVNETVSRLLKSEVIGWFQGRMEWGPRALGNRSIISNPCDPKMADILNLKVKHREKFRPFAPVITEEDVDEYFEADHPIQHPTYYMLMVYPIRSEKRKLIPSVTHADGSGRLQVIRRDQNPRYYDVIKAFQKKSKVPILINTSFNIRGEPIVCTPQDAYRCMMGTGIDVLIMGSFLIERKNNPRDQWDSEKYSNQEEIS